MQIPLLLTVCSCCQQGSRKRVLGFLRVEWRAGISIQRNAVARYTGSNINSAFQFIVGEVYFVRGGPDCCFRRRWVLVDSRARDDTEVFHHFDVVYGTTACAREN